MLALQNTPLSNILFAWVGDGTRQLSSGSSAKYDLSLNITEKADGLLMSWEYNVDLFEGATIARMADHFKSLLSAYCCPIRMRMFSR